MVIFRENTEDVYAGLELQEGTEEAGELIAYLREQFGWRSVPDSGIGIKPIRETGSEAARPRGAQVRRAPPGARASRCVHKGNIQKFTEGAFREWGYELVRDEFADVAVELGRLRRRARGQDPRQGRHRGHHLPAGADPARTSSTSSRPRTSTATTSRTRSRPRSAASGSRRAATSTT